ncbi:hypothetical protein FIBSPDRAFT_962341 [Athelia psychrophila]|uniref:Uncharacterized protein n=1 Tax=Athelia psychrophila TaxID=1759441 RepID=A0A166A805_9AGAM|nr:hypothetical protein FIBSPDRAFT_962341 [Fibularhizoctonia sp. CBS 109695]
MPRSMGHQPNESGGQLLQAVPCVSSPGSLPLPILSNTDLFFLSFFLSFFFFHLLFPAQVCAPNATSPLTATPRKERMTYDRMALFNAWNALLLGVLYLAFQAFRFIFAKHAFSAD